MGSHLLFDPIVHLYLLYIGGLVVASWWPGQPRASRQQADGRPVSSEQGRYFPETVEDCHPSLAPLWNWGMTGRVRVPIWELKATCCAEYSARFSTAIKHIRKA